LRDILELFKELTSIPRCSGNYSPFIKYLTNYAALYNYSMRIDAANNILCKKEYSKTQLCLQAHYDMVCLLDNQKTTLIEKEGFYYGDNSSLGADNGIGCAYMLGLMSQNKDCEFLFTSDEEIGLVGANNIELTLQASYMLNLDSEEEGGICIGCAGGVDISAKHFKSTIINNTEYLSLYEISLSKLPGGHSGVNIHENIPNAIKLLAQSIKESKAKLLDINAGERINSIPVNAKAIVASKTPPLKTHENMQIKKINAEGKNLNIYSDEIINFLYSFSNGTRAFDKALNVTLTSINLALIHSNHECIEIQLSARSMQNDLLKTIKDETLNMCENYGFEVQSSGKYFAWKPDINDFTKKVLQIYKKHDEKVEVEAIHAGLECAIFKEKFPHMLLVSIGPNIYNPHSSKERVEIRSILKLYSIVTDIVESF